MPINGVETVVIATHELEQATQFFQDFGLPLLHKKEGCSHFRLEERSNVILKDIKDPSLPKTELIGGGAREVIWGVDTQANLESLVKKVAETRGVTRDSDGVVRFFTDSGIAFGLRVYDRQKVVYSPDPVNASGNIKRLNQHRKWRKQAIPKTINHVVFMVKPEEMAKDIRFLVDVLNFRITDVQDEVGTYLRADGTFEHHSILIGSTHVISPDFPKSFNHMAFGVEDIDELMVGNNVLTRKKWESGFLGVGRHRIASALHSYWKIPGGAGEAEFSADTDYLDDNWQPRHWSRYFGQWSWSGSLLNFPDEAPPWDVEYLGDISIDPEPFKK